MQNPLVAVIIPIYNVKDYLRECLDSVLNQSYQNLKIILVDDASTDGSFEIAKEYFQRDLRVTLIRHKHNSGLSTTRNTGINYLISSSSGGGDWFKGKRKLRSN